VNGVTVTDSTQNNEKNTDVSHFASSALNSKIIILALQILVYLNSPSIYKCIDEEITLLSWLRTMMHLKCGKYFAQHQEFLPL